MHGSSVGRLHRDLFRRRDSLRLQLEIVVVLHGLRRHSSLFIDVTPAATDPGLLQTVRSCRVRETAPPALPFSSHQLHLFVPSLYLFSNLLSIPAEALHDQVF